MSVSVTNISGGTMMGGCSQKAVPFSGQLKQAGKEDHDKVEQAAVIRAIFDGSISEKEYMDYLACLYEVYSQLEKELCLQESNPQVAPLIIPDIFRASTIKADLKAFGDEGHKPNQQAREYRAHLQFLGQYRPHLLIAHAYLRYLGDLFGGQMIARKLKERFDDKLNFHDFTALCQAQKIKNPTVFAIKFREILDALPLDEEQKNEILEEVAAGYRRHEMMFKQLRA